MFIYVYVCYVVHMKVRGQLLGVSPFFPLCGWELKVNSGHQRGGNHLCLFISLALAFNFTIT